MSNFTPGPWHVGDEHGAEQLRPSIRILRDKTHVEGVRPTTYVIGSVTYPTTVGNTVGAEERRGNARLIAAAPTQHEEMVRFLPIIERAEADPELWARLTKGTGIATANGYRAAIAKATGKAP